MTELFPVPRGPPQTNDSWFVNFQPLRLLHRCHDALNHSIPLQERPIFYVVDAAVQEALFKIIQLSGKLFK